jgi:hypothetical protein
MSVSRIKYKFITFLLAVRIWFLSALGIVALGGLYYFLATVGPRRVDHAAVEIRTPEDPALARMSDAINELEKQYRMAADANMVTAESTHALEDAIDKQRELLRTFTKAGLDQSTRLVRLETELDSVRARGKVVLVDRLEKDGEDLLDNDRIDEAGVKLREALQLQRDINLSSASSRYKNYVRETALVQAVASVEAAPLFKEKEAALAAARQAASQERWADALTAYTAARDAQIRLNREYGRTRYADTASADLLNSEIESLNAAGIAAEIEKKEKAGDVAVVRRLPAEAANYYEQAGNLQLQVNQNYPRSRFVSSRRIEDLEVKRQTALSSNMADTLAALDTAIIQHLRKRQVVAAEQKLGEAAQVIEKLFAAYPKSQRLDGALRIKFAYLGLRKTDLRVLQDEVYDRLLPLPGVDGRLLMRTEVTQSLYVMVMNTNPSRNPGRSFPVDSVSWTDASEFCTRLSWLLGYVVRLPTTDEFRVALGDGINEAWSSGNAAGHSHQVGTLKMNAAGFSDLLGNLAEWADTHEDSPKAPALGGSYLDTPETLATVPSEMRLKSDRARHVGLRVMVDQHTD